MFSGFLLFASSFFGSSVRRSIISSAMNENCLFCKIIAGKIPTKKVYEDELVFAFEDINPKAPTHVLIIPKKHIVGVNTLTADDLEIVGYSHMIAAKLARERNIEDGYRTVYNVGPRSGQSVFHLHLHLLGGRDLTWPPG
jgi:histidine triad (HIT) family protein